MGDHMLSVGSFRQMCGRAGRLNCSIIQHLTSHSSSSTSITGQEQGEAVIMMTTPSTAAQDHHLAHLLTADYEPLASALAPSTSTSAKVKGTCAGSSSPLTASAEGNHGIERLLLELICCGRLQREDQVLSCLQKTFLATQLPSSQVGDTCIP
jgi:hypothetical protein